MPTTPTYALPYPAASDPADVPTDMNELATALDGLIIAKTIADAKGDLLVATAADTIARLAVGTNGYTLVADSAAAAGVSWQQIIPDVAWTSYAVVWSAESGGAALNNGLMSGFYQRLGRTIILRIEFTAGSTTAFGTGRFLFSLPAAPRGTNIVGNTVIFDSSAGAIYGGSARMYGTNLGIWTHAQPGVVVGGTAPYAWAVNDSIAIALTYEAAAAA